MVEMGCLYLRRLSHVIVCRNVVALMTFNAFALCLI